MTDGWLVLAVCVVAVLALSVLARRFWGVRLALILGGALTAALIIVGILGVPGPEPVRRYPLPELRALAADLDKVESVEFRDPEPTPGGVRCIQSIAVGEARVDYLRARVLLSSELVMSSEAEFDAALDAIIEEKGYEPEMILVDEGKINDLDCSVEG